MANFQANFLASFHGLSWLPVLGDLATHCFAGCCLTVYRFTVYRFAGYHFAGCGSTYLYMALRFIASHRFTAYRFTDNGITVYR